MKIGSGDWLQMYMKDAVIVVATAGALIVTVGCSDDAVSTAEVREPPTDRLEDLALRDGLYYKQFSRAPFTGPVRIHAHGYSAKCAEERAIELGIDIDSIPRRADEDLSDGRYLATLTDCVGGEGEFVDGKKHGIWARFAENGKMLSMQTYNNGVLEGPSRTFYLRPAEQLRVERIFEAGELVSSTKYLADGEIESVLLQLPDKNAL